VAVAVPPLAWKGRAMGWEEELFALFDDLEQQAEALYDAERDAELADRSRAEYHHVTLASRLMASVGHDLTLDVRGAGSLAGQLERMGDGWCLVRGAARDWVVAVPAVLGVRGASERSVPEVAWPAVTRLGLGSALRRIAGTGEPCVLHLVDGTGGEAVLRRVGADFVEAEVGERPARRLVAFAALAAVQSGG
jgi:hypothetical protein